MIIPTVFGIPADMWSMLTCISIYNWVFITNILKTKQSWPSRQQASPQWQIWTSLSKILLFNLSIDKSLFLFQQLMVWLHILTLPAYAIATMQLQNALLSSPAKLAPECEKCCIWNSHLVCMKFSGDDHFELLLSIISTCSNSCTFLLGRVRLRGQSVLHVAVGSHSFVHNNCYWKKSVP